MRREEKERQKAQKDKSPQGKWKRAADAKETEIGRFLRRAMEKTYLETYAKNGLTSMAKDILNKETSVEFNCRIEQGRYGKPWQALGVEKDQYKMLCFMNADAEQVRIIQIVNEQGKKITRQQLEWWSTNVGASLVLKVLKRTTPERLIRFLKEQGAEKRDTVAKDYYDYLEELKKLNMDYTKRTLYPQDLIKAHKETSELCREKERAVTDAKEPEKNKMLQEMQAEAERHALEEFRTDLYIIKLPKSKSDFIREGQEQANCVATYLNRVLLKETMVFFVRKASEPDKAFATVETDTELTRVIQCRTKYNKNAPDEVKNFVKKAMRTARATSKKLQKEG